MSAGQDAIIGSIRLLYKIPNTSKELNCSRLLRAAAAKLSGEILKMIKRPATAIVNTCFEGKYWQKLESIS